MGKFLAFVACFASAMSFAAPVATIGEMEYETLAEAFAAVPADGTQTMITILEDIAISKTAALPATKSVILDLNNHTISGSMSSSATGVIQSSGSLVIRNGTVAVSGKGVAVKGGAASAKITLESGTIAATGASAKAVQMASTGLFQMEGGSITSETEAISASNVVIHDGAVSAKSYALSGGGVVTGGELSSSGAAAIYATATLAIEGGTISGANSASAIRIYSGVVTVPSTALLYPSANKVSFTANASAIVKTDAASVAPTADLALYNGETLIGFASSASTATTIKEMSGTTVKLLKDITTTSGWAIQGNDVTVDLNGHSISSSGLYAIKVKGSSASSARAVTITGEGTVSCDNGGGCVAVYADQFSNVTLAGGAYSVGGDKDNACVYIAASKTTAPTTVTITGGSYETGDGKYVLNINDAARTTGGATMAVTGGTFKDFDPANNTVEGEGTSFIGEGIVAVPNEDGVFEVRDYVWVKIPEVEHATASATIDGTEAEIVDGKIKAPVGSKVVVKYAAEDEWANTLSKTYSKIAADTTVDVSAYKPVPAKVKIIAKDGTVSYSATLTTMNAKDGATYQLLTDVTTSALTLGSLGYKNNSITLDLNGHTLRTTSTSAGFKFNSNGSNNTLTVKNGTFISAAEGFAVNKTNTLVLEDSLTVKAAKSCVTVVGNGATLETAANLTTTGDTFAIAGNGSAGNGGTTIKVSGGSVTTEGKAPAIYQPQSGSLEITGGTITGASAVYAKCGEISITGGKLVATGAKNDYAFNGNGVVVTGDALVIDNCNYPGGAPTVSVTGGRFESANGEAIASYAGAKAGETAPAPITGFVSASGDETTYPTFNKNLAEELCGLGFQPDDDGNGVYTISKLRPVCEVEGEGYWSLQMAAEAAAKSGNPVVLIDTVNLTEQVLIDGRVTIDLAGHSINYVGEETLASGVLGVKRGGALTIEDSVGEGVIDAGEKAYAAIAMTVKGESAEGEIAALTVNGGTIKGYYYGIVGHGARHGTSITINDGTVTGTCPNDNQGIYHPQEGTLTINGGTVTGYSAGVEMRAGSFTMTGGELIATADHIETNPNGSGTTSKGAALAIAQHTTKKPINITISGGELNGFAAVYESNPNKTDATDQISITITGGQFTATNGGTVSVYSEDCGAFISGGSFSNRVPDELCNEGFDATELLPDGSYGVTPKKTVAKIGSREFWSIDRAIEAAEKGEVVELVADYTGPGFVVGDLKEAQFSTAGFTYTATSPISVSGHLVIADESTIDFKPTKPEDTELFALVGFGEKVDISAGSFNVPLREEWCDEAYEPAELGDGRYGVTEKQHVCKIGDKGYWSVEAALKAADPFDTIVMIEDVVKDAPAVALEHGHVTLDLNGHVISSVLVSGAVVTVTDSKRVGYIGGADVEKAVTIEAGKLFVEGAKVIAKEKALAIEQSEQGELIEVGISGGTFVAETVLHQANVNKLPSTALDQITINVTDGVFTGNVYAEDKRAFITGGQFDPPPEKKYKRDDIKAEQPSVTVTTELDVVNPYDFKISLREALLYAEQDSHNGISEEGGYKITFNWDAIKDDAVARGVEATGVFDLSAAPFEATSELYDETTGRCKFILIDGTLDAGADGMMGEGDRMAVIRGFDFHTKDTVAPVRAVVVGADPESVIRLVDKLEERGSSSAEATEDKEGQGEGVEIAPDADQGEIDDSDEGVCELDGELYTSVRQALAAVPADGKTYTLKLVDDFTGKAFTLENGQNVVLDLGGHRYEVTNGGFTVKPGATLLLKNGSIRSNTATTLLTNAGELKLENLDLDLSERPAVTTLVKTLAGSLVVTGSTSMTGTLDYVNAECVEFRGTGNYDLEFNAPLTANIRIYSGHFADPDAVPVEFQVVPLDGLYWQIVDEEGNVTKYATLHEAYATIPGDGTPVTITELFDQTDRGLVIDGNKNVTIDFNGKTFTVEGGANHNFIIDGKREVVTLKNGTLRTTAPGMLISNKGHLTLDNMNIDLRACELNPDFKNIISSTYGETIVTGDTRLAVPSEYATLAVTAQRNDDWSYDKVEVTFDENFTGQVIGQIHYGESTGTTKDVSWLDAARINVDGGEFDVTLVATTPLVKNAVENFRLHGGTFTRKSAVGLRPIGDFAYTIVDIDWELRLRYAHFERSSFDLIGRDNLMLVDRCSFAGASARKSDWILESDATGRTRLQFLNSVIHQAEGAILVNMSSRDVHERGGFVVIADSTIGESTGDAVIKITADDIDTYLANATFYGNAGKVVDTLGRTHAVNVLSQKNGENLPSENVEIMTSIYQEEYADAEIFRMSEEDPTKPYFGPRYLREGTPVDEATQEGAWSLTSAYHLNDESVAGGNCRYIKLAINNDGYVEAIRTSLKPNGPYTVFAGAEETDSPLHTLHYDQTIANLDRGQPSKGAFWIPVDEPSLVVTTIRDTVNPTDLEISLREAINYAKYLATEDKKTIPTITFDWEALDEELAALRRSGVVGTAAGQLDDFTMYLGCSIDWDRRSNSGDCRLVPGRSAAKPISITADELPQGLIINANRSGSVRPYFTVNGALWGDVEVPVAFELGDNTKLKTDHFRVTAVDGTGYQIGKNANLYLVNSSAADSCREAIVGDEGSTVVLERASVANNASKGVTATNVSAQNATIDGPNGAITATTAELFNTTVVGGIAATTVNGVNDIVSGSVSGDAWFRFTAFDACAAGDTNTTHNIAADDLALSKAQSSLLWHYRFEPALDWGRLGTAISSAKGYDWTTTGAELPTYVWGQRTTSSEIFDVEAGGVQALPDTWAAYRVGEDEPYATEMKGAILNDLLTNTRNPHFEQLSMGAWQGRTIVAWKTLAKTPGESTDHATDFSRVDLNSYFSTLQEAVEALTINKTSGDKNVQFDGKDAIFLVSATLTNTALGENEQTIIKDGDVAIVGNSYYWSGLKSTSADAAIIVSNDCSVAFSNVGLIDSTGDGVRVYGSGHVSFNRSAVNGNGGDGIRFMDGAHGDLKLVNTTVAKNVGTGVKMQSGTAEIYDSTIAGNGTGLAGAGEFYLANSIVLKNREANEESVTVKNAVYSVLTATGLTSEQEDAVFRDASLSLWYRMLRVNYTGAAGWMGTKLAHDTDGNWFYLDRGDPMKDDVAAEDWTWTPVRAGVTQKGALEIVTSDQQATSRLLAENAGFHEYAVGAYVPEMELEVEVMDQFYPYAGKALNPDPNKAIYRIRTGIGKLNQGHELYYNAADKMFYGEFAYVTNRVVDALGVAPAPWGEPTVSKPRTDLGDFAFSADIIPVQAGDKINVLRRTVPGARVEGGFSVDEGGYAYLDGYPFTVSDVMLTKGGRDLTASYTVRYPQTESRDYAMMYITPKSISLSRAFAPTKEYDGTANVVITADSLEHAGILFGEVVISPGAKFEYNGADVVENYQDSVVVNPDGSLTILANKDTALKAENLGFIGSPSVMGNYYITNERSENYTSLIVPKKIRVSLGEIAKKLYDGETTTMTFDFTDDRLIYTATNSVAKETMTLAEALILPTRYLEGKLVVAQTNVIDGVVCTNVTQVFSKDAADYPFFIIADDLRVRDAVETSKDFTRNYAFDFTDAQGVFTVEKRPVTLPIAVEDIIYSGEHVVAADAAISAEPIPTGVKDEAFTVRSLGETNARYEMAHVKGNEERQKIAVDDPAKVVFEGVNGAEAANYKITFAPTGRILKRPLFIKEIKGVQTKLYDGSTVVRVDANNRTSYDYVAAEDQSGLLTDEFVKLTGEGRVANMGVGATHQKVEWNALSLLDDTGKANDYALQPFETDYEDVSVRIEPCDLQLAFSTQRIYDGTLNVTSLALTATTTNSAGKVTTLQATPVAAAEGAAWSFKVLTGIVNERTDKEEVVFIDVTSATLTRGEVNTYAGDRRDVLVVAEAKLRAEAETGAVIANYRAFVGDRNIATEKDFVGTARINRRPITFQAANRSMTYGGMKPDLTAEGSYKLLNESDLAAGDRVGFLKLAFDTNNIRKSRSGEFQKGYYEKGIVRGDVSIVDENGVTKNRNYTITVRPGALQVGPGKLTMVLDATPFVKDYDGTTQAESNYETITLEGLIENNLTHEFDDVTVTGVFTYDTKDVHYENDTYANKTVTFVRTAIGGKDAANYDWATDAEGNVIVEVSAFGATINPRPSTVNVSAADKAYDSTCDVTPTTTSFSNLVAGEEFDLEMTDVTAAFADKHRGENKPVTVSLNGELLSRISPTNDKALTANYAFTFDPNTTATIRGIPFAVAAESKAMTYGDANPDLTVPMETTTAGDTATIELNYSSELAKSTSGNFTAKTHEEAIELKTVVITDAHGEEVTDSYDISYTSAALTVAPRTLTVSVEGEGVTKVYDGTTVVIKDQENHAIANNITATRAKNETADEVDVTGAFAYNSKDVLAATTVIFSNLALTGADAANYTLAGVTEVSDTGATITPLMTTVTIAANNKTYDGNKSATAKSAAFAPLVGDERFALDLAQISGSFADRHAASGKAVTWVDYSDNLITTVDGTGAIKSNYKFAHNLVATATINPKPATITFAAKDKVYDATVKAERTDDPFVFEGLVAANEDAFAEAFTLNDTSMSYAFSDKNVGEGKTVTASGYSVAYVASASTGGESVPSDYAFAFTTTAKADITKKPITISYTTLDKVYDANTVATRDAFDYGELIKGDVLTLNDKTMLYAFETKDVGEGHVVTATGFDQALLEGADVKNYEVSFNVTSSAAITRRPVTITFALVEKTYDGTVLYFDGEEPKLLAPIVANMAEGESLEVRATGAFVDKVHNETTTNYFRVDAFAFRIGDGQDLGNYTVTYAVDRVLELTVGAIDYVMPNDAGSFFTDGRINRKPMTVTANGQAMTYGETIPEINTAVEGGEDADWNEEGSIAGDHVAVTLAYSTSIPKSTSGNYKAGSHTGAIVKKSIIVTDVDTCDVTDSYAITYKAGALTVAKRNLSMTLEGNDFTKVYDGNTTAKQTTHTLVNTIVDDVVDIKGTYNYNSKNVVEAATVTATGLSITGADAANYQLTAASYTSTEGATITERPTVITVKPANKVYDGTTSTTAQIESFSNLVAGESFNLDKTRFVATYAQSDVGTGVEVTYVGYDPSQVSTGNATTRLDNYSFTFTNKAVGDITKRPSTITWAAENKEYDALVAATVTPGSFKFGNLVDGESFTMNEAGFTYTFDNKNVGTAKPVTAVPNGTLEAQISPVAAPAKVSNYAFTLTKTAPADITPAPLTITFTTKDKTYDATPKATRDKFTYAPLLVDDKGKTDDITLDDSAMEYAFVDVDEVANTGKNAAENKVVKTVPGKGYDKSYLRGVDKDNYEVSFTDESTATINKMELRLDLPKANKVYDATTALSEGTLVKTLKGAGSETFTATASGEYKDLHVGDSETYVTVSDLTIAGDNGAVFGNYLIRYAGHGAEAVRELTETGTYENATFNTTESFGTPGRITKRTTVVTFEANDKHYDQTTEATHVSGSFTFDNLVGEDSFSVTDDHAGQMSYTFADKHVGMDKIVTAEGWRHDFATAGAGTNKDNYEFVFTPTATAELKAIELTISFEANDKVYDATTTATRKGEFIYAGLIEGDVFALDDAEMRYDFDTKNVGTEKTVTATGFDAKYLTGADVKNYDVHFTDTAKAAITKKNLTLTLSEAKKVYDGTTAYTGTVTQVIPETEGGEIFTAKGTGAFVSRNVGSAANYFNVTTLDIVGTNGADFGNYVIAYNGGTIDISALNTTETTITAPFMTNGTINKKPVTVTALSQTMKFAEARPNLNDGGDDWTDNGFVDGDVPTVTLGWNEAVIAKSKAGHAAVGTHLGAIVLSNIANDSNYTVTFIPGNLEVQDDPVKILTIGAENPHLPITIPSEWLDRNVPTFADWAEANGHALVSDALLEPSANGYAKWQNYLLGLDPLDTTAKLWIDGVQTADEDKMRVRYPEAATRPTSDYAVHFRLDAIRKGGKTSSPYQPGAMFDIALDGDDPTGYYAIQCVFTSNTVASANVKASDLLLGEGLKTVNAFGLLKVEAAAENTALTTPWTALAPEEERDVAVADLLKTATLEEGDIIYVYSLSKGRYESYAVSKEKVLVPVTLVENDAAVALPPATEARVARGSGVMLSRKNPTKPVYLIGQLPTTPATTRIAGATTRESAVHHLIGAPGIEDFDIQSVQPASGSIAATASAKAIYDQIFVPSASAQPIMYTYKDGKWGYDRLVTDTFMGMTFSRTERVTNLPMVKAGTGFWYVSRGGDPEIVWPVIGKEVAE